MCCMPLVAHSLGCLEFLFKYSCIKKKLFWTKWERVSTTIRLRGLFWQSLNINWAPSSIIFLYYIFIWAGSEGKSPSWEHTATQPSHRKWNPSYSTDFFFVFVCCLSITFLVSLANVKYSHFLSFLLPSKSQEVGKRFPNRDIGSNKILLETLTHF